MKVRSVEDSTEKYLRNSVLAYLEGQQGCDLGWIEGCIGPARAEVRRIMETRLAQHASTDRYRELMARL